MNIFSSGIFTLYFVTTNDITKILVEVAAELMNGSLEFAVSCCSEDLACHWLPSAFQKYFQCSNFLGSSPGGLGIWGQLQKL